MHVASMPSLLKVSMCLLHFSINELSKFNFTHKNKDQMDMNLSSDDSTVADEDKGNDKRGNSEKNNTIVEKSTRNWSFFQLQMH